MDESSSKCHIFVREAVKQITVKNKNKREGGIYLVKYLDIEGNIPVILFLNIFEDDNKNPI